MFKSVGMIESPGKQETPIRRRSAKVAVITAPLESHKTVLFKVADGLHTVAQRAGSQSS